MHSTVKFLLLLNLIILTNAVKSQDTSANHQASQVKVRVEGMLAFSAGQDFYSMNVGGPSLFLILNRNWKIGIGALPSLYLLNGKLGARLGVSPRIDYKSWVLIAPFFHRDTTGEWISSVGLGYKFHKKQ